MNRRLPRWMCAVVVAAVGILVAERRAEANSQFLPFRCNGAPPTSQPYTWTIGVDKSRTDVPIYNDPAGYTSSSARYDNQQAQARWILTNQFVTAITVNFNTLLTEGCCDFLHLQLCSPQYDLSGNPGTASKTVTSVSVGHTFQGIPLKLYFTSDFSNVSTGVDIPSIGIACNGTTVFEEDQFSAGQGRIEGILQAYNDVVFTTFQVDASAGSNTHYTLAVWAPTPTTQDFDVYLACGRDPTSTNYDIVSDAGTGQGNGEFVHIDPAVHPCSSSWHVAVLSYGVGSAGGSGGQGIFHMLWSKHNAKTGHVQDLHYSVGIVSPTSAEITQAQQWLSLSAKRLFGATNGQVLLKYDLYNVPGARSNASGGTTDCHDPSWSCGGAQCQVCLTPKNGTNGKAWDEAVAQTDGPDDIMFGYGIWNNNNEHIVHEFGHAHLNINDFYMGINNNYPCVPAENVPTAFPDPTCSSDADCASFGGSCVKPTGFQAYCSLGYFFNACGHSVMANGHLAAAHYCTSYDHMYNPRFVDINADANILPTSVGSPTQYTAELVLPGFTMIGPPPNLPYPAFWNRDDTQSCPPTPGPSASASDFQRGIANGTFLFEPSGSSDPYLFETYNLTAFTTLVGPAPYHP